MKNYTIIIKMENYDIKEANYYNSNNLNDLQKQFVEHLTTTLTKVNGVNDIHDKNLRKLYLSIAKKIDKNVNINTIYDSVNKVLALPQFSFMDEDEADYIGCAFYDYILDLL